MAAISCGKIITSPFSISNLQSIYNPYSEKMVARVWGKVQLQHAVSAGEWMREHGVCLENIGEDDEIIWVGPGETILGHTNEFIGGRESVTTMMKALNG